MGIPASPLTETQLSDLRFLASQLEAQEHSNVKIPFAYHALVSKTHPVTDAARDACVWCRCRAALLEVLS